jgi:MFS family permease
MAKSLFIAVLLINFINNVAYNLVAPFYPKEAMSKGIDLYWVGFIFTGYSLSMLLASPVAGKMMTKHGRKNVMLTGLFLEGTAMIVLALLSFIQDPYWFAVISFFTRAFEGAANACINTSSQALLASQYSDKMT